MNTIKKYRICTMCKENKRITEFIRNRSKKEGRTYLCKPCNRIDDEKKRQAKKEYIKKHKELFSFLKTKPRSRPVAQYTMDGKFLKRYTSSLEASKALNININSIMRAAKSANLSYKGYRWKYILGEGVKVENTICQCCGKLTDGDLIASISLNCVQELQEYRRARLI